MAVPTELLKMPLVNGVPIKHGMRIALRRCNLAIRGILVTRKIKEKFINSVPVFA